MAGVEEEISELEEVLRDFEKSSEQSVDEVKTSLAKLQEGLSESASAQRGEQLRDEVETFSEKIVEELANGSEQVKGQITKYLDNLRDAIGA